MNKTIIFNSDELAILTYALMFTKETMAQEVKPQFDDLISKIEKTKFNPEKQKKKLTKRNK